MSKSPIYQYHRNVLQVTEAPYKLEIFWSGIGIALWQKEFKQLKLFFLVTLSRNLQIFWWSMWVCRINRLYKRLYSLNKRIILSLALLLKLKNWKALLFVSGQEPRLNKYKFGKLHKDSNSIRHQRTPSCLSSYLNIENILWNGLYSYLNIVSMGENPVRKGQALQ